MKKMTRFLTAAALSGVLLVGGTAAFAAEGGISVQLDGQELSFTDAVPQVKDQRTFLPFRAVFEAMGAEVSNEGSVITATRDGKTLTMTLNETAATVTEGDKTTAITMDVAPYVDSETWRTYVPVRFAAQAFGCAVGWDQEKSTAVIVDAGKVVDEALEGKSFTYLEKLVEYSEKYNEGIWDMEAGFDANLTMMAMPMTMSGTLSGTVADNEMRR
ncbi:MAG: copper amine oxidase N-terminal domain-containing protein [Oscillospiraceae bacterium]|nr:copper amine oxidase N-terminal domain-containing protein [Oscillospiraceae bacterium]